MHVLKALIVTSTLTFPALGQLDSWAKAAGLKYFGTAVDNPSLNNQAYMKIVRDADEFGQITPANGQKWSNTESGQGRFSYGTGDAIANVPKQTGQLLRCHTLVWYNQLPSWVSSSFSRDQMQRIITSHIQNVAGHYKGQCYAWDVVNEAMEDDGKFRQSPMYKAMGVDYITHSFKTAAQTDPGAKLYYNDFNIERCCNAKINATLVMLKTVIAAGARVDGVGMQGHSRVGKSPSKRELKDTMAAFSQLVDELAYTEIDIRHTKLPTTAADREQQAKDYLEVVGACLETPKCVGITVWDFTDQYSWIPGQYSGEGEACLWDKSLNKKPAYTSVISLLQSAASAGLRKTPAPTAPVSTVPLCCGQGADNHDTIDLISEQPRKLK
ncbi:glycoside hydrolase superfamily [Lasiosphaeria miniovina]|uniref:Beta-xylanase n=1 Tax=Lasiosphaeria miniovina TaxID=1954250 RepID=A0AA40DR19_9PEZI|nr:glycoside hydrolase superfamily [Lasiosphaeria miniovina]KAK0710316.1 glycoside hydrolase superfamily [Lasiosphaeria miniovina]